MLRLIQYSLILVFLAQPFISRSQNDYLTELENRKKVSSFKDKVHLTFIIDSAVIGTKSYKLGTKYDLNLEFESDYLQVKDNFYIKIFITRNQEYGSKFYSWKWDYLNKTNSGYNRMQTSNTSAMDFNNDAILKGSPNGQGIGREGESYYYMIWYRYKLE